MDNKIISTFHTFLDNTKYVLYITCAAYILILFFIVSPYKINGFFDWIVKILIAGILFFALFKNYNSLGGLYQIPGIFTNQNYSVLKTYFLLNIVYSICIAILAIYVLYTIFY